jgi:hypothetical protein
VHDRPTELARPRSLGIDMNPLPIAGEVGEQVDLLLVDGDPAAYPKLLT